MRYAMHFFVAVSAESKLIAQLACLRCAKTECKQFSTNVSLSDTLSSAMHCADEQVIKPYFILNFYTQEFTWKWQ